MNDYDYDGKINVTRTGQPCKDWSLTRHTHLNLERNYCRAPREDADSAGGPWCYSYDFKGWGRCNVPVCNSQFCPRFDDPNLLALDGKDRYQEGETVYLKCKNGVSFKGSNVMTCLSNGKWNSSQPSCDACFRVDCRHYIGDIDYDGKINVTRTGKPCRNWSISLKYQNQTKNYCRTPPGDADNADGPWCYSNDEHGWERCNVPVCNSKQCAVFDDPNLLTLDNREQYREGETVYLACKNGYSLIGNTVLTCLNNGHWNSSVPRCEGKQCPPLYVTNMNHIETGYRFPESLIVPCKDGYESLSKEPIHCSSDGTWSSIPLCIGKLCQPLNVTNMNQLKTQYRFPESFTLSCKVGFVSSSMEPVYCTSNGTWNRIPTCKSKEESSSQTNPVAGGALWPALGALAGIVLINSVIIGVVVVICRRRNISSQKHVDIDYEKSDIQTNKEGDTVYDEICTNGHEEEKDGNSGNRTYINNETHSKITKGK